jgi:lambda family phage portal protein
MKMNALDRAIAWLAPMAGLKRLHARATFDLVTGSGGPTNFYEGGSQGRRTGGWRRLGTDSPASMRTHLAGLRGISRDLDRNNPYANSGFNAIARETVGEGIVPQLRGKGRDMKKLEELLVRHSESTEIDSDGLHDLYGQQRLVMRTIALAGEVLVRRRRRFPSDGLALPFQFQILEPDYLDTTKDGPTENGGRIVQGVEFSPIGARVAYWLYPEHPGSALWANSISKRVPADDILHLFRVDRPGQVRGVPWMAPAIVRLHDLHDYENAQMMRQKIAACFAAFEQDVEGPANGANQVIAADNPNDPARQETLTPGIIQKLAPGKTITFSNPPTVGDYDVVHRHGQRQVAVTLGITYEVLTGDLSNVNFSSGRMGWMTMYANVNAWRKLILIPGFCKFYEASFFQTAAMMGLRTDGLSMTWTPPRREMINPAEEIKAAVAMVRAGFKSRSEFIREWGFDPVAVYDELQADNEAADERGLILDSDPRKVTQVGNSLNPNSGDNLQ